MDPVQTALQNQQDAYQSAMNAQNSINSKDGMTLDEMNEICAQIADLYSYKEYLVRTKADLRKTADDWESQCHLNKQNLILATGWHWKENIIGVLCGMISLLLVQGINHWLNS